MVELLWFIPDKIYGCQANEFMVIQYHNTPIFVSIGIENNNVVKRLDMSIVVDINLIVVSK